jgi:hypothetical protein
MTMKSRLAITFAMFASILSAQKTLPELSDPVERAVCVDNRGGGAPKFARAKALVSNPDNYPKVEAILDKPELSACWYNAAMTLGASGTQRAVDRLIKLLEQGEGKISLDEYEAKFGAALGLGWAANKSAAPSEAETSGAKAAMEYIVNLTNPEKASLLERFHYTSPFHATSQDMRRSILNDAFMAMGLSGNRETLGSLKGNAYCAQPGLSGTCEDVPRLAERADGKLDILYP